jgi:hypothetical protein
VIIRNERLINELTEELEDFFTIDDIDRINNIIRETLKGME